MQQSHEWRVRTARVGDHTGESSDFPGRIQDSWHVLLNAERKTWLKRVEQKFCFSTHLLLLRWPAPPFFYQTPPSVSFLLSK